MKYNREAGSALLVVFVFAAIVGIMLYLELPVTVFEARRQREQLLIDHGNEYAHAVKLFVRKIGRYPASIGELENTNGMRFLRRRFNDPFTGKADWRILHAAPNGALLDSKVKQAPPDGVQGNTNSADFGMNSAAAAPSSSSFLNEAEFPSADAISARISATISLPKRPPAIAAAPLAASGSPSDDYQNPGASLAASGEQTDTAGQAHTDNAVTATESNVGAAGGTVFGGAMAGVASIARGASIKAVNHQREYVLWEFYYDPTKDPLRFPFRALNNNNNGTGAPGFATASPNNSGGANIPNSNNPDGQRAPAETNGSASQAPQ